MRTQEQRPIFPSALLIFGVTLLAMALPVPAVAAAPVDSQMCTLRLGKADWLNVDGMATLAGKRKEIRLPPGTYHLEWGRRMAERVSFETYRHADSVRLQPGHTYSVHVDREHPFGMGYVPYLWIEDGTGQVVSGLRKERPESRMFAREHEPWGVFLRITIDMGSAQTSHPSGTTGPVISSSGGSLGSIIAAGMTVRQNLAVHFTWMEWSIDEPRVESDSLNGDAKGEITLNVIGAGLTYFWMPANLNVSGSIGVGNWRGALDVEGAEHSMQTDPGPVVDLSVGKEWWTGEGWAMGVGGAFGHHWVPDGAADGRWSGSRWMVRFSLTFN